MLLNCKPKPKLGDIKSAVKFAWLPIELSDGRSVWLEKVKIFYRFQAASLRRFGEWQAVNIQRIKE